MSNQEAVVGEDLRGRAYGADEISGQLFLRCHFLECIFEGENIDVAFEHCSFEACTFSDVTLQSSGFFACSLETADFHRANFDHSSFVDCNLRAANFIETSLFGTNITRTEIDGAEFLDCDLKYAIFEDCDLASVKFDDSDLSGADLESSRHVDTAQLEPAIGNLRSRLPRGVQRPLHWEDSEAEALDDDAKIPDQRAAPLRVVWRADRLVPDPRGGAQDRFRDPSVIGIFRAFAADIEAFVQAPPTNHPVVDRVRLIHGVVGRGAAGLNPAELGYHLEVLRIQNLRSKEELSETTAAAIEGIVTGGFVFVSQFEAWRTITSNADVATSRAAGALEIAAAIREVARESRRQPQLIDRRISESLELQAQDLEVSSDSGRLQEAAANSTANLFSALSSKFWRKAGDEALKAVIKKYVESSLPSLQTLLKLAPHALGWMKGVWPDLFP